ncbi:response regulator [Pontiella sp.]|uniref:response regulator n=1 Tax=Pontiella sp. TaxID=2837462 RepID=UPI0035696BD9
MIPTPENKPLVLVADDDITIRMIARECLEESGFRVEEAQDGHEAVEFCTHNQPDAVMLDVLMPGMGGYESCRRIRAVPGNENLPILMMTALDDVASIEAAYAAGATEFTGKPVNWTIEAHRLTSMIRAAETAKEIYISKQEWERTFNALDEIITIQTVDRKVVQANAAAIAASRTPMESVIGKSCDELFCDPLGGCATCPVQEVIDSGEKKVVERVSECMEGTFLVSVFPVFDDAGNLMRIIHMAKDITERQQLEDEVRRAQKMDAVGTLAGGLAHDFNNLLQVIIGYTELATIKFKPEDTVYQYLSAVKEAAWRGNEITRQLLTVSRKTDSRKQPLILNELVRNVSKLLEYTIPKMIFLQAELTDDIWAVNADPSQLEQMLMNLAVNAKHAMPEGGSLIFHTRNVELDAKYCKVHPELKPGNYVMLSVTDTGCGMNQETQARIFEPFFTTRAAEDGTGLGLAMVYGIVQEHDGHLICYSEVGEGTSFKVYLPALGTDTRLPESTTEGRTVAGGREMILLVDDEPRIRHLAKKLLANAGYQVLLAGHGQEALEIYAENRADIDFIILDLNMPVMGGLECLDTLRLKEPELPVLLASGFARTDESEKRLNNRYTDYINKPYHEKEFLTKVRSMLDDLVSPQSRKHTTA